jgi:hypothetical protein
MNTITVNAPVKTAIPRGAAVAARWFVALLGWLEKSADRRVQSRQFVNRVEEASRLRSYAQQVMSLDPRYAADLFAAADRHERS